MERRSRRRIDAWIVVAIVHVGIALLLVSSTGGCGRSTRETGDTAATPTPEDVDIKGVDTVYEVDDAPAVVSDHDDSITGSVRNTEPVRTGNEVRYVVQPGDSLWKIARKFGVTVDAIADRNDIQDTSLIRAGRELWIPNPTKALDEATTEATTGTSTTPTVTDTTGTTATVTDTTATGTTPTDTTVTGTTATDTTVTGSTVTDTAAGETISSGEGTTPTQPVDPSTIETFEYQVQPGDTIWKLARQYHTTTKIIMDLNGITDATKMRAGDTIRIPKPAGQ